MYIGVNPDVRLIYICVYVHIYRRLYYIYIYIYYPTIETFTAGNWKPRTVRCEALVSRL